MIKKEFIIKNSIGLHARPAAMFVDLTSKFESDIMIGFEETEVNAKSIISVLSLGLGKGDKFLLKIDGEDEKEAMAQLEKFINDKLKEEKGNRNDII